MLYFQLESQPSHDASVTTKLSSLSPNTQPSPCMCSNSGALSPYIKSSNTPLSSAPCHLANLLSLRSLSRSPNAHQLNEPRRFGLIRTLSLLPDLISSGLRPADNLNTLFTDKSCRMVRTRWPNGGTVSNRNHITGWCGQCELDVTIRIREALKGPEDSSVESRLKPMIPVIKHGSFCAEGGCGRWI